jgi:ABC-type multidrug transport system fused ATPase/permease subunit
MHQSSVDGDSELIAASPHLSGGDGTGNDAPQFAVPDGAVFLQSDAPPMLQQEETALRWSVLRRLGKKYLGAHAGLVLLYAAGSLFTTSVLPSAIATRYGALTNFFQSGVSSGAPGKTTPTAGAPSKAVAFSAKALERTYFGWLSLVLLAAALGFGHKYAATYVQSRVEQRLQGDAYESALRQSLGYYHVHPPGEVTMVVSQLTSQARTGLFQLLVDPLVQSVGLVIVGLTLYSALSRLGREQGGQVYLWFATIALFAFVAPVLVVRLGRKLQMQTSVMQRQDLAIATLINGSLTSPEEIQAMEAEPIFAGKYKKLLQQNLRAHLAQAATIERLNLLNSLPGSIVLIAVIGVAISMVTASPANATPKAIVQVGILTPLLMGMVQSLASFSINARLTWPSIEAVDDILQSKPVTVTAPDAIDVETLSGTIDARNLTFSYSPGSAGNVLNDVSFDIASGEIVGLVARPGRGKTTLFRLLLRFYDPQAGTITLGGYVLNRLTLPALRRNVALMTQQSAFFHDTVRENFLVAAPKASDDDIRRVAEQTSLWQLLRTRFGPRPLDAQFAGGQLLSGGEKKLFALTRLMLQSPSVILFDEPTVGMGPLEKEPLIGIMRAACRGKTVISVDHDILWQMRFCDRFLVLHDGQIVQRGSAAELLSSPGLFREMHDSAGSRPLVPAEDNMPKGKKSKGVNPVAMT